MKQLFIAFVAIATLFACKKEDSFQQPTSDKLLELQSGSEYLKLQYGTNGKLTKAIMVDEAVTNGEEVTFNIAYNAEGRISEVQKSDGETIRPVYENNRLVRADVFEGVERIGYTAYGYENGVVKTAEIKFTAFNDEITMMKFAFTYDAQQRVSQTSLWMFNPLTDQLEFAGRTNTEYDNKVNPLYSIKDFLILIWEIPAPNNIVKETQFNSDGSTDEVREYNITYNDKNQPSQAVMRSTSNGQQSNTNISFRYR